MSGDGVRPDTVQTLSEFWAELLDIDAVHPDDRLVELGGNSLVAVMLANRVEFAWGFRPTMEELMTSSLRALSVACDRRRSD